MTEGWVVFDRVGNGLLECTAPEAYGQLDAEALEKLSNLVFAIKKDSDRLLLRPVVGESKQAPHGMPELNTCYVNQEGRIEARPLTWITTRVRNDPGFANSVVGPAVDVAVHP